MNSTIQPSFREIISTFSLLSEIKLFPVARFFSLVLYLKQNKLIYKLYIGIVIYIIKAPELFDIIAKVTAALLRDYFVYNIILNPIILSNHVEIPLFLCNYVHQQHDVINRL